MIPKMRRFFQVIGLMSRWERLLLGALAGAAVLSGIALTLTFYYENTVLVPATGGTYIEGSVGSMQVLSPWFTVQNDVNRDIVSLVFSGLLQYNPKSRAIEDDLAALTSDAGNKIFTLRLKENIFWQDSTKAAPHPVTADDVVFTFKSIQDPEFPNTLLRQNFSGVKVEKIDDRTVRFTLDSPYGFFPSNLTIGLLPQKSFEGVRVGNYDKVDAVGAGPYRVRNVTQTELSSEVTLERFERTIPPVYHLDRIVFRIFPDYSTLLSDLRNLQGVRLVNRSSKGIPMMPKGFQARNYYLPQYVALFFNLDRPALSDAKLRLGLQLGTNKQAIVDSIGESVIVDTPLLQIDVSDWHYQFDPNAAQGALLASKWNIPERVRLQKLLEQDEANKTGLLRIVTVVMADPSKPLTLTGTYAAVPRGAKINGLALHDDATASGSWMLSIPYLQGTGALKIGDNLLRVTERKNRIIDSMYVTVADTPAAFRALLQEQELMNRYVATKTGGGSGQKIAIGNLALEDGRLRVRKSSDLPSVRINEKGEPLKLRLLTSPAPAAYKAVAENFKKQWALLGVDVTVDVPKDRAAFEVMLLKRDYDVLLFGQSLLDNPDSFPYWHSSGIQKLPAQEKNLRLDAYNLSQYSSFKADSLLETVRRTGSDTERRKALSDLRELLKNDVPAVFLYSPLYTFAHRSSILGIELGSLSLHSDRFLTLSDWYVTQDRAFTVGKGWLSIFHWTMNLLTRNGS